MGAGILLVGVLGVMTVDVGGAENGDEVGVGMGSVDDVGARTGNIESVRAGVKIGACVRVGAA